MDEGQPLGLVVEDLLERSLPPLEVDVGRRSVRDDVVRALQPHAAGVAGVQRPFLIDVRDVMGGVAGRGKGHDPELAVAGDVHVLRRHRDRFSEERVEPVSVDAARACNQPLGIDHVRPADFADVHLDRRVVAHEQPRGAGVVEMDVRDQQVTKLRDVHLLPQPLVAGRGSGVEERRAVLGLEQVDAYDAVGALV